MRYFNVFGPRQDPKSQYAAAVPIFIDKAIKNEPITIFGDGEQTRDFIYVKDVVAANVYLAENESLSGVYNTAYGKSITIKELANQIVDLTGSKSQIQHAPVRSGDVKHSMALVEKLIKTGFSCNSNFQKGLQETISFFKQVKI
jgi:UDP-glucose 4-epimerase